MPNDFPPPVVKILARSLDELARDSAAPLTTASTYSLYYMSLHWFQAPKRVHGIYCKAMPGGGWIFAVYECADCQEMFLMPESAIDEKRLHDQLRHECSVKR